MEIIHFFLFMFIHCLFLLFSPKRFYLWTASAISYFRSNYTSSSQLRIYMYPVIISSSNHPYLLWIHLFYILGLHYNFVSRQGIKLTMPPLERQAKIAVPQNIPHVQLRLMRETIAWLLTYCIYLRSQGRNVCLTNSLFNLIAYLFFNLLERTLTGTRIWGVKSQG